MKNHLLSKVGDWQHSVIRRSILVLSLSGPAMLFNLGLVYFATNILPSQEFGVFYLAITITNIMFAPSVILSLFYSRHFVTVSVKHGETYTLHAVKEYIKNITIWSGVLSILTLAVLLGFGELTGITAPIIIFLIVLVDFIAYIAETARAALQGLHYFTRLGLYTFFWMLFRFLLALAGLVLFESISAGLLGVALSPILVFPVFYAWLKKKLRTAEPRPASLEFPKFKTIIPIALGYSIFVAIANLDILLAYFFLNDNDLGVFSSSSILPKGIILITMPIMQVIFPVIVAKHQTGQALYDASQPHLKPELIFRAMAITLGTALFTTVVLILGDNQLCSGSFGIRHCEVDLIWVMALSAIPLCMLRLIVMIQFAMCRDWTPLVLVIPMTAFVAYAGLVDMNITQLAEDFMIFSYATFILYSVLALLQSPQARKLIFSKA